MSNIALAWAWGKRVKDPVAKIVLLKLADQANDSGVCWPSRATIADHTNASERTISRKIGYLAECGLLEIRRRERADGGQTSNVYILAVGTPIPGVTVSPPPSPSGDKPPLSTVSSHEPSVGLTTIQKDGGAQDLVAYAIDQSESLGSKVPARTKGHIARTIKELLDEGFPTEQIRTGITYLIERRLHPSTLPSLVHEAGLPARRRPAGSSIDSADLLDRARRLAEEGR